MKKLIVGTLAIFLLAGLLVAYSALSEPKEASSDAVKASTAAAADTATAVATFAGGCFWCMEAPFDKLDGVHSTISGYTAGHQDNPTYRQVSAGGTGHTEAVQVTYDPTKISYAELLDVFWMNIDPEAVDRQFCDRHDDAQRQAAEASKTVLEKSGKLRRIVTELEALDTFYPAEEYHQDYYLKNPKHYNSYRTGCGRDRRLKELWGTSH